MNRNNGDPGENTPESPPANMPDRHEFDRVKIKPGRCNIRDRGKAVYRSQEAYRKKSESYLASAKILFENKRLEETVLMAYYSMYYMVLALLFATGIKCENHSGAMILLENLYGIDNTRIAAAKRERIDKQYYVDFAITV